MALFLYLLLSVFGFAVYLTRPMLLRATGSLAGGAVFALAWMIKLRIDYAMG